MAPPPAMTIDQLQQFLADAFPSAPVPYVVEELSNTGIRMRLPIGKANERPGGTVSGPSLMALADCAAWLVIVGQIGPVVAVGTLLKLGKRLAVAEVAMFSVGSDAVVAKAQVTYSIPPR